MPPFRDNLKSDPIAYNIQIFLRILSVKKIITCTIFRVIKVFENTGRLEAEVIIGPIVKMFVAASHIENSTIGTREY